MRVYQFRHARDGVKKSPRSDLGNQISKWKFAKFKGE